MNGQSRRASVLEALANMITGYLMAVCIGMLLYPLFGARFTIGENFAISAIFYIASFVRSYVWRRIFNHLHQRGRQ